MNWCRLVGSGAFAVAVSIAPTVCRGEEWVPIGPPGGDARSLATDTKEPQRVFLGTADGMLYVSEDGGGSWHRRLPGFPLRGCSLDGMVVDPRGRLLVGYWDVTGTGGGVARSDDAGLTFTLLPGIAGESVRALAVAPSDPDILVVGTLTGVFRSADGGSTWTRLTPAAHPELKNFESVAIDSKDPRVIYAGTWHLAWKTVDGGQTWRPIKTGMIDDSDVFTLTVDRRRQETLYGTACSGIYRSTDAGARWTKIGGIPASSRRTRAFLQDPGRPDVFFAGTTEGLWRSTDDLASWRLVTDREMVINAVAVLPGGKILAATDGAGVLRSEDGGASWTVADEGFSERFVARVLFDSEGGRVLSAIREDRQHGGVFAAAAAGGTWRRVAPGLEGREVFTLALLGGTLFAGTDAGLFRLGASDARWERAVLQGAGLEEEPRIGDLAALPPDTLLAASSAGLLVSDDGGRSWRNVSLGLTGTVDAVAFGSGSVFAATRLGLYRSLDRGRRFEWAGAVPGLVHRLVVTPSSAAAEDGAPSVLAATTAGLYRGTAYKGALTVWRLCAGGLPVSDIAALDATADGRTVFASDFRDGGVFRSDDGGQSWHRLTSQGLRSDRLWTLAADPRNPDRLLGGAVTGGLHLLEPPPPQSPAVAAAAAR